MNKKNILSNIKIEQSVVGFSGSPRKNGNSDILLKTILSGIKEENIPTEFINLSDVQFKGCIGCEKCRNDKICTGIIDGMTSIYPNLYRSQGLVLVSPTHNYNITSWTKAFLDRLYCFYKFENTLPRAWSSRIGNQNRKAVVAAVCEQTSKKDFGFTLEAMKEPLKALGYEIVAEVSVLGVFDKAGINKDKKTIETAYAAGKTLASKLNS